MRCCNCTHGVTRLSLERWARNMGQYIMSPGTFQHEGTVGRDQQPYKEPTNYSPLQTERGSLSAGQQPSTLSLAGFPSGSLAFNTVWVGGGFDLLYIFSPAQRGRKTLCHGGCGLSGAFRPQLTEQGCCYFLHVAPTPITD